MRAVGFSEALGFTLTRQNLLCCRVLINSIVGFLLIKNLQTSRFW